MHEGAHIYDLEREAINQLGMAAGVLFRIVPELRKYHKYGEYRHYQEESDEDWLPRVEAWKHGNWWELEKDPEILAIVLGSAK